jgi:putative hydrolase of the HAD superfamily
MAVRAVIFDFGGVLCFHPSDEQVTYAARFCGVTSETFLRAFWGPHRLEHDAGRIEPEEYWGIFGEHAGVDVSGSVAELVQIEIDFWSHFDQRVLTWIRALRSKGVRTAVLSNLPRPLGQHLRAIPGFLDPFDHVTFSYELKLVKPQREIYEDAIRGLDVAAHDALFLDDRLDNVEGAVAAGLRAELYQSWEDFWASGAADRHALPSPENA